MRYDCPGYATVEAASTTQVTDSRIVWQLLALTAEPRLAFALHPFGLLPRPEKRGKSTCQECCVFEARTSSLPLLSVLAVSSSLVVKTGRNQSRSRARYRRGRRQTEENKYQPSPSQTLFSFPFFFSPIPHCFVCFARFGRLF